MSDFEAIIENASELADNVEDSEMDTNIDKFAHWQQICAAGLAAISAGCSAWLQLNAVALVLNTNDVGMSSSQKQNIRRSMLDHLFRNDRSCHGLIRMSPNTFTMLCTKLQDTGRLRSYAHTSAEEQVATFMFIIGQKITNRAVSWIMSRSGETCSRYFHNVLNALISIAGELLVQPTDNELSSIISRSRRFYPFFKDCMGALDGTHVRVKVPKLDQARYRGRKDFPTQNVLACCSFDMRFTYILAGWEGSASDSRVLKSALTREDPLIIPNGKYYLGDSGFGLSNKILVPYGRTRYHLKEYSVRGPENAEELFNLRHASLRNCIERCFGILKKRFPIIATGAECQYSCDTMTKIILACCILHNFLLDIEHEDAVPEDSSSHIEVSDDGQLTEHVASSQDEVIDYALGKELRDSIALDMWRKYQLDIALENSIAPSP